MKNKVLKGLKQHCEGSMFDRCGECPYYNIGDDGFVCRDQLLMDANETVKDSVSQGVVDQFKWERDMALEQLAEIGKGLGSKMDDIVALLKKQEAHVMTIDEIHAMQPGDVCYCEWIFDHGDGTSGHGLQIEVLTPDYDLCDDASYTYLHNVENLWTDDTKERRWSAKPTKEQMEETPWEEHTIQSKNG